MSESVFIIIQLSGTGDACWGQSWAVARPHGLATVSCGRHVRAALAGSWPITRRRRRS